MAKDTEYNVSQSKQQEPHTKKKLKAEDYLYLSDVYEAYGSVLDNL